MSFESKVRKKLWSKKFRESRGWVFAVPLLLVMGYPLELSILLLVATVALIAIR